MIGIIDYGMGNLGSVSNACAYLEMPARIVEQPKQLAGCKSIILPGVGAFGDCMQHLTDHGFVEPIREWIASGRPFLGICLGLQSLYEGSEEAPGVAGLGVLRGTVRKFNIAPELKVPQIGWNSVKQRIPDCPLYSGIPDEAFFYFVHSYYVDGADKDIVAGETNYGLTYTSVVWRDNVMAAQFHPEKSQKAGLRLLQNFGDWAYEKAQPT
jgi:imidazole glycerol phosphate synthase glutamine amidotransferase subunit